MIYKRCGRCGKRIPSGTTCECLKKEKRNYKKPEGIKAEYHKERWKRMRAAVLSKYNGIDIFALYYYGHIEMADTVHHIEQSSKVPELFYCIDNLIPVSRRSHDMIHEMYKKNEKATKDMLKDYLNRYKNGGGI